MNYTSPSTLLGLPLVHVAFGEPVDGHRQRAVARGWIAIGDTAYGVLFALGSIAFGGIALGGIACGVVALGGLALGLLCFAGVGLGAYSMGGLAIGILAVGGFALAWQAAYGGMAVAAHFAMGGLAIAAHANDPAAHQYMETGLISYGRALLQSPWLNGIWLLFLIPAFLPGYLARRRSGGRRAPG